MLHMELLIASVGVSLLFSLSLTHLLSALIYLESFTVILSVSSLTSGAMRGAPHLEVLMVFVVTASSAAAGLGLLTASARSHGSDQFLVWPW